MQSLPLGNGIGGRLARRIPPLLVPRAPELRPDGRADVVPREHLTRHLCGLISRPGAGGVQEDPGTPPARADRYLIAEAAAQRRDQRLLAGLQLAPATERNADAPPVVHRRTIATLYGGGGNRYHLARSITGNGLADGFRQALEDRVYVGISGGSMIFSRALDERSADIFEDDHLRVLGATTAQPPFGFFDWYLQPHLYSPAFPNWDDAWADRVAARADFPIYFIDDDSAVRVDGDAVDVVGEGRWRYLP